MIAQDRTVSDRIFRHKGYSVSWTGKNACTTKKSAMTMGFVILPALA
jgi:hypothetical protein